MLRLEFDHSKLDYYTEIDALLLVGTRKPIHSSGESADKVDKETGDLTKKIMDLNIHSIPPQVGLNKKKKKNTIAIMSCCCLTSIFRTFNYCFCFSLLPKMSNNC